MDFRTELIDWINRYELNSRSNTPDHVLAEYILESIRSFDKAVSKREENRPQDTASNSSQIPPFNNDPFGVGMLPPTSDSILNKPIPAEVGNKVTTGWSNPFGGTSWGV